MTNISKYNSSIFCNILDYLGKLEHGFAKKGDDF